MANRNRIALNQQLFSRLIDHANQDGANIQNETEARWLARLNEDDARMMASAKVAGITKLTRTLRAAELNHDGSTYFVFWGFSRVQNIPDGLVETDITPALFLVSAVEGTVPPVAGGLEIKEAVEGLYKGVDEYNGHGLETIIPLYPSCQVFAANVDYEFTRSLARVTGALVARSYDNGPIEMSEETLSAASNIFEAGSAYLPFEIILQGLMSISWRGFYLGLYRCIEQLFPVTALKKFLEETGEQRPIIDLAELFEKQLSWRPKEEPSLEGLGSVDKLIGPEASGGDMYEAEVAC